MRRSGFVRKGRFQVILPAWTFPQVRERFETSGERSKTLPKRVQPPDGDASGLHGGTDNTDSAGEAVPGYIPDVYPAQTQTHSP